MLYCCGTPFSVYAQRIKNMKSKSILPKTLIYLLSSISIATIIFMFIFVFYKAWPVVSVNGLSLLTTGGFDAQIQSAFTSTADSPLLKFGFLGLI